jgi:hypothetical protein
MPDATSSRAAGGEGRGCDHVDLVHHRPPDDRIKRRHVRSGRGHFVGEQECIHAGQHLFAHRLPEPQVVAREHPEGRVEVRAERDRIRIHGLVDVRTRARDVALAINRNNRTAAVERDIGVVDQPRRDVQSAVVDDHVRCCQLRAARRPRGVLHRACVGRCAASRDVGHRPAKRRQRFTHHVDVLIGDEQESRASLRVNDNVDLPRLVRQP